MTSLRYGVLSLFALSVIFLLALKNYDTWTHPVEVRAEKGVTRKSAEKTENPPAAGVQKESGTDIQSYIFVSQKNIFTPERKEFPVIPPPGAAGPAQKVIVRPKITLYGVTLAGDYQSASIADDRPRMKGERETRNVKVGDPIGDFKITKILPDRILVEATGDSFEVLLYDTKAPKLRSYAKTEAKPATVTSTLAAPAGVPTAPQGVLPATVPGVQSEAQRSPLAQTIQRSRTVPGRPTSPLSPGAQTSAAAPPTTPSVAPSASTPTPTVPRPRIRGRDSGIFGPAQPAAE